MRSGDREAKFDEQREMATMANFDWQSTFIGAHRERADHDKWIQVK
jgi:hypothetical protein